MEMPHGVERKGGCFRDISFGDSAPPGRKRDIIYLVDFIDILKNLSIIYNLFIYCKLHVEN